jgi:hypothetical protein
MDPNPAGVDNPNYTFAGKQRDMDIANGFMARLNLHSFDSMEKLNESERGLCPKCKGKRKFYCYDCMIPVNDRSEIPQLELPVDVTIIRHPKEKKSKSSVIPSKILAPNNVEILHSLDAPDLITDKIRSEAETEEDVYDSVVLMFPTDDAKEIT